ncbi:AzlD domain-containing protein [Kribbella sandramycini]|uniref:AzlD domain-containing protein n=1 Tax=Kribbella sandramycini TaxID=60450 RepID=A0A7Y4L5L8_9ACTN|nr:AzlD domain-containing protein [Kribbella sandramycini]MBB6567118.1 branched-subunit amino acid transport protein [Kribbella sandramycini]NOL44835.1 AzlD domain-containing protein [Kribbella sandramycini]
MTNVPLLLVAIGILAVGTFTLRIAGPAISSRFELSERVQGVLAAAAVVLLSAVVATAALTEGHGPVGVARPAGVLVGGVLAWRKAPFIVVVVAAAATAAGLRLLGVE